MPERCRWLLCCMVALVLLQLPSPSIAFLRCCCCRSASLAREDAIRCTNVAAAEETNGRCESPRSSKSSLKEMELWLDEVGVDRRGGGCGPPAARLTSVSGRGIGLTAAVELERDSTVASIPRKICFSSDAADAPAGTLRAWAHDLFASIPSSAAAACSEKHLSFERDVAVVTLQVFLESAAGARSTCAPWMAMLNRKGNLNLPALWPDSDLEGLKGTLVLRDVEACLARAKSERVAVAAAMVKGLQGDLGGGGRPGGEAGGIPECTWLDPSNMEGRPTFAEWLHARCTVQSRAYRVGRRYLLIPLVDFANHDDDVAFAVCPGDGVFTGSDEVVFVADQTYRPGEEVCTTYGDMDNAKRLFSFGFVTLKQHAAQPSQRRLTGNMLPLPTEAFCDVELTIAATDALRVFKETVLRERRAGDDISCPNLSAMFLLTPFVSQLVEGPARLFVESVLPVLRLVALTPEELTGGEASGDACDTRSVLGTIFESRTTDTSSDRGPVLVAGKGRQVLAHLGSRLSLQNEQQALRLLAEQSRTRLGSLNLTFGDVEALRAVADDSHESKAFAACGPRSLLCATVRVGEGIAWYALLKACAEKMEGCTGVREEQTWASWTLERCDTAVE
ncbi:unnamed protein product [Ectocarpus sp. 12 AP-2014]